MRLASAEADCAGAGELATVAKSLDTEYRAELRRRYPGPTSDLDRLKREALPRARVMIDR